MRSMPDEPPRALARRGETRRPALRRALDGGMAHIDEALAEQSAERRIHLDPPQSPLVIEQRQLVGELAYSENFIVAPSDFAAPSSSSSSSEYKLGGP